MYSCINYLPSSRAGEQFLVIEKSALDLCGGKMCAAALLSDFCYLRHNRLEQLRLMGSHLGSRIEEAPILAKLRAELWIGRSHEGMAKSLLGAYSLGAIKKALRVLCSNGYLEKCSHPLNPRGAIKMYRVCDDKLARDLEACRTDPVHCSNAEDHKESQAPFAH